MGHLSHATRDVHTLAGPVGVLDPRFRPTLRYTFLGVGEVLQNFKHAV